MTRFDRSIVRGIAAACAVALALAAAPVHAAAPPASRTLANGLVVTVLPDDRSGTAHVLLRVPAGLDREPAGQPGVASLTAQLLLAGTSSRTASRFADDARDHALVPRAAAARDYATLQTSCLAGELDAAVELLADAAMHPVFSEREFQLLAAQGSRALLQAHAAAASAADEQIWPWALPGDPAAGPLLGTVPSVLTLTREQLRQFHRAHWRPDGAELVVAGAVTPERAFALAEEWFGRWSTEPAPAAGEAPALPAGARVRIVDLPSAPAAEVRLAWAAPGRGAADEAERAIAARVLESRLEERFANARIGRDARVSLAAFGRRALWIVSASAPPESAGVLVSRLRAVTQRALTTAPAAAEVAAAARSLGGAYPLQYETLAARALRRATAGLDRASDDGAAWLAAVAAATPARVAAAAARGTNAADVAILVAGPAERLRKPLAALGAPDVLKLDPERGAAAAAAAAPAPKPEDFAAGRRIVQEAIAAHGGIEALRRVVDSVVDADLVLSLQQQRLEGTLKIVRREPGQMSYLTEMRDFRSSQVLSGDSAWTMIQNAGQIQPADSAGVAALKAGFRSDIVHLLLDAVDPTARAAANGEGDIAGVPALRVDCSGGAGGTRTLWFDATTKRLIALDHVEAVARAGNVPARRLYRDFRSVSGVLWPYLEERVLDGQPFMSVRARDVRVNVGIGDVQFARPTVTETKSR